jgi:hypothetical protein
MEAGTRAAETAANTHETGEAASFFWLFGVPSV